MDTDVAVAAAAVESDTPAKPAKPPIARRSYSIAEIAARHAMSLRQVKLLIGSGKLPAFKIGKLTRISVETENKMVAEGIHLEHKYRGGAANLRSGKRKSRRAAQ